VSVSSLLKKARRRLWAFWAPRDPLERRFAGAAEQAARAAATASRAEIAEAAEELGNLKKLLDAKGDAQSLRGHRQLPALLLIALGCVGLLLMIGVRRPQEPVRLDIVVSSVNFTLADASPILRGTKMERVMVSKAKIEDHDNTAHDMFQLERPLDSKQTTIGLAEVSLAKASRLRLFTEPASRTLCLSTASGYERFDVSADGPTQVLTGSTEGIVDSPLFHVGASSRPLELKLRAEALPLSLCDQCGPISISELAFSESANVWHSGERKVVRFSSIERAEIQFVDLPGNSRTLARHDALEIAFSAGHLRSVRQNERGMLELEFYGVVTKLDRSDGGLGSDGGTSSAANIMPTYLEWLLSRYKLSMLVGALTYLVGLVSGVSEWFRRAS
jgi:hypothetical protein